MKTLKSNRIHIGIFGKTNVGKSSFLNKITNQEISIVSQIAGTTTDVVEKSMELLPIGPVTFLDTAGFDDQTTLGKQRIEKTIKILNRIDVAILICDYDGYNQFDKDLIEKFKSKNIPYINIINKSDQGKISKEKMAEIKDPLIISTFENFTDELKQALIKILPEDVVNSPRLVGDLVEEKSTVILVTPIDKQAPKGRLILPQVQAIRDLLDSSCICILVQENELKAALDNLKTPPSLVITDSQAFKKVDQILGDKISLTSFSILFARLKGDLDEFIKGAEAIDNLKNGDKILVLESCSHHQIEDDIATVKIPNWLRAKTGLELEFTHYSGHDMPSLDGFSLIIHCGACMTNRKEILSRIMIANQKNIPITNYGIVISYCLGILSRATAIFTNKIG